MITVKLQGGLGNQLFQYATARALAEHKGTRLGFDVTSFESCSVGRRYSLGLFRGIPGLVLSGHSPGKVIRERSLRFDPQLRARVGRNSTIEGYFQCERYFHHMREELANELIPAQPVNAHFTETTRHIRDAGERSVFMTVRRTDYVGSNFHGLLGPEYYRAALATLQDEVGALRVFVFSDDPEWCRANLGGWLGETTVWTVAGNFDRTTRDHMGREDLELMLMRYCRHAVCANSSYSWWGAWLGADLYEGKVIAPKQWFGPEGPNGDHDIVPERWIRL